MFNLLSPWTKFKAICAAIGAAVVMVFVFIFRARGRKIKKQKKQIKGLKGKETAAEGMNNIDKKTKAKLKAAETNDKDKILDDLKNG